ncbi:RnfABCDGE type electron transport complex subunit G [Shewanella avicenniae]|uniref:Ion-translocating oxidoreductase complex subunit G n=1 Tax=Shewanella avicenniae TaxID=2814294 RepID=A0ABX7QRX9_9GAMM|nr:RnfABCDGE type electron transport complex subunit G [Shewanella avicenniae]QSX34201.1 RnfABCDGE type electron transport complex subunit G [Shewanella avicenniae]
MQLALEKWKDSISYQSGLLATICGGAALILVLMELWTRPLINLRIEEDQNALLDEVLAGAPYANKVFAAPEVIVLNNHSYEIFTAKNTAGSTTHYVVRGAEEGFSGKISFLVGVDIDGVITGVRIISHTETPGLGDKIELAKSQWITSFNQHSLANTPLWGVKKDGGNFDQFSGATITPRAVVKGVHSAMQALANNMEKPAHDAT